MKLEDIKTIGVIGGGTMGHGIAINFALKDYPVIITDLNEQILQQSKANIHAALKLFAEEELIDSAEAELAAGNITTTTDLKKVTAESDFITEAIVERAADKRDLFKTLDEECPPQTILASNTSWMVLADFTSGLKGQERMIITHYFAPPHIVPGVEVAGGSGTSPETYNLTCDLIKNIGKVPIKVLKESPGCLINRLQDVMRREANILWAEGVASAEDIELGIISTCGFRMPHEGSMKHFDLAGMWQWPSDVLDAYAYREADEKSGLSPENIERIRNRYAEGRPWFIDPENFDEAIEARDRDFIRRLKALYRKSP